ncbi:MAG: riboflavin synthase [Sphingomonadaceae bacterium]|uniref:riboflavin synthase n=1 Tax=Thermaurantiacus sp. TaxID=2820283 RepID=UPI00298F37CE|nr:riboflavin synthase [Thermaurantiacus sp.]MCS6986902.1 riboflavin synthase [Sphingomonadaceae bacterium]MDW8415498.1 riboflavin synthase [Thermaurantiacus sp.]
MFTGIVAGVGRIVEARAVPGEDLRIWIEPEADVGAPPPGASVACSGVCLTVVRVEAGQLAFDVSAETRARTPAGRWEPGRRLNLERSLKVGDELGGHIVTGHVDGVARVVAIAPHGGSLRVTFEAPAALGFGIAPKGSIAVDGVSLTVNEVTDSPDGCCFGVNLVPHTAAVTTLGALRPGDEVAIEIDVLARYLRRLVDSRM